MAQPKNPSRPMLRGLTNLHLQLDSQGEHLDEQTATITLMKKQMVILFAIGVFMLVSVLGLTIGTLYLTNSVSHDDYYITGLDGKKVVNGYIVVEEEENVGAARTTESDALGAQRGIELYEAMEIDDVFLLTETRCLRPLGTPNCGSAAVIEEDGTFIISDMEAEWSQPHIRKSTLHNSELITHTFPYKDTNRTQDFILQIRELVMYVSDGCRSLVLTGSIEVFELFDSSEEFQDNLFGTVAHFLDFLPCGSVQVVKATYGIH